MIDSASNLKAETKHSPAERANMTSFANRIKIGGVYNDIPSESPILHLEHSSQLRRFKPEIYAITAVIIDRVFSRLFNQKEKYSPPTKFDQKNPYGSLQIQMKEIIFSAALDELEDLDEKLKNPENKEAIKAAYSRLIGIIHPVFPSFENANGSTMVKVFVNSGIETAVSVMVNLLKTIPEVYVKSKGKIVPIQTLIETASNSYPLLARLASMDLADFVSVNDYIWNQSKFVLVGSNGNQRLDFQDQEKDVITKSIIDNSKSCPAMVNFGEESAMKKLWQMHVDAAKIIYSDLYK